VSYIEQRREICLQGLIITPYMLPKPDLRPISHFESHKSRENPTPPPNVFQYSNPIGTRNLIGTPPSPHAAMFNFNGDLTLYHALVK
jgi:hypothetical protein